MTWPIGVTLRTCTLGPDFGIVSGSDYGCDIVASVSRPSMTWGATGSGGIGDTETLTFVPGQEVSFQLPVTDQAGWYIGGLPVDLSNGKQSHVYTLTIKPWIYNSLGRKTFSNTTLTLSDVPIPTGTDPLDLDMSVAVPGAQGGTVTIPDLLASLQASVDAYKTELEAVAAAPTDSFVADRINDPTSETTAALNAAIAVSPQGVEADNSVQRKVSPHASTVFPVVPAIASVEFPLPSTAAANRHNAFPSLARLADGLWLTVWRSATDHQVTADGQIWLSTSTDGVTWAAPTLLDTSDVAGATDRRDPTLAVVPATGEVLLTFYDVGTKRSYLKRSTDNGATWSGSTEIPFTYTTNTLTFVSAPVVIRSDGVWFIAAYDDAPTSRVQIIHSTDSGATWTAPQVLTPAAPFAGYLEPNIIPLDGTNLLMLIRSADQQFIYSTTATNAAGSDWSTLRVAFAGTNNPHAIRFASGTVAVFYRDNHNGDLMTRTTFDGGATWSLSRRLSSSATFSANASAVEDPDHHGHALMVWASEDNGPACVQATTISEAGGVSQFGPHLHPNRATTFAGVPSKMWLPASAFRPASGTPAEGSVNDWPGWLLSHGEADTVRTTFQLPDGWRHFNAVAHFAPVDANAGNVVLSHALGVATFQYNEPALAAGATITGSALSAGGTTGAHRTSRLFATQPVAENTVYKLTVSRAGANAADTYASDVVFLGVELDNATTPVIV